MSRLAFHKAFAVALCTFAFILPASSQVRVGLHGGVNLSDVTEPANCDRAGTWQMQTYGFGGIAADLVLAHHWQLATEVNFIRKGIRIPLAAWGLSSPGTVTLTANYFEVPITLRYRLGRGSFQWYLEGGASLALLESARALEAIESTANMGSREDAREVGGMYRQLETSLRVGLGGEYQLTEDMSIVVSTSFALGLSDVYSSFWADTKSLGGRFVLGLVFAP